MGPRMREALDVMKNGRVFKMSDLENHGIDRRVVGRLKRAGYIHSTSRRCYQIDDQLVENTEDSESHYLMDDFSAACLQGGDTAFICLYPAAAFHGLNVDGGTQYLTVGLSHSVRPPVTHNSSFKFTRMRSEFATTLGVEEYGSHKGVPIRITNKPRTVVDLVRHSPIGNRDEIDEETAIDAVNRYISEPDYNPAELNRIASAFGVEHEINIMIKNASRAADEYPQPASAL